MLTNASSGGTWTVQATCQKCGKPYMYIGDPVGDISQLICTCNQGASVSSGWPSYSELVGLDYRKRIADALERIAAALEAMKPEPKYYCAVCGKESDFFTTGPYGAKHEDANVCADCFDKLFS